MHAHLGPADGQPASRGRRVTALVLAHPVLAVAVVALFVRLALIGVLNLTVGGSLFEDDSTYPVLAAQRAADDVGSWGEYEYFLYDATATFLAPLTAAYRLFGPSVLLGQLLAAAFATAAAAATTRTTLVALPPVYALGAGAVVALMPSQVLFSSLVLKDAAVWAVLTTTALAIALMGRADMRRLAVLLPVLAGLLWMLSHLRLHTLVAASCAAAIAAWVAPGRLRVARGVGALLVCVTVPLLSGIGPLGYDLVRDASGTLEERRQANAVGAATAFVPRPQTDPGGAGESEEPDGTAPPAASPPPADQEVSSSGDLRALPRGLSVLLLEPLPGQVDGNPRVRLALYENLLWWPLLMLALIGILGCRRHLPVVSFPVLCGGAVLMMYALAEGNFGTAYRHRGELVWAVAILASFGVHALVSRRRQPRPAGTGLEAGGTGDLAVTGSMPGASTSTSTSRL